MGGLVTRFQELSRIQKILIIGIIVILVGSMVLVFSGFFNPRQAAVITDSSPITLTWRKPFFTENDYNDTISAFKQKYPNVTIKFEPVSREEFGSYYQNIIRSYADDNPPDIFSVGNSDLPALSQYMAPIDFFKGDSLAKYREAFTDLVVAETMQLNKVYGIAGYVDNIQMYYNKDILQQSGISLPARNWDEMVNHVKKINRRNTAGQFIQHGIAMGTANPANNPRGREILPIMVMQNGGIIYDRQNNVVGLGQTRKANYSNLAKNSSGQFKLEDKDNDNATKEGVQFFTSFSDPQSSNYSWNRQAENAEDAFVNGKLAYILHYSYFKQDIERRNPNLKFEATPIPQLSEAFKKTMGSYFMDGMGKHLQKLENKRKRQIAEEFLIFLASKDEQRKFNNKTQRPPARRDLIQDIQNQNANTYIRTFASGSLYADNYYRPQFCTDRIWIEMIEDMQTKSLPLNQAITEAVNKYNNFVRLPAGEAC